MAESTTNMTLDKNNPDSIYNWITFKITSPGFRNIIKDFIDDNCSLFIDVDENTFQQGQLFNEFTQLIENLLGDLLAEGGISQEQFLAAAERGLSDKKNKKYYDQLLNFSEYNYFKSLMTKRNYQLIKKVEEEMAKQQEEREKKKQEEIERQIRIENQKKGNTKTEREIEEEKQRILLHQFLNQEEEEELQKAIQESLAVQDEKRKIQIIEDEELKRAIKQSLLESVKPQEGEKIQIKNEEKKPEPKKEVFTIEKKDMFNFEQKEEIKTPAATNPKNTMNSISSNTNFQFSGNVKKEEEKPNKPSQIFSASKGFEFQIESKKNDFGISSSTATNISNISQNPQPMPNPYARPSPYQRPTNVKIENPNIEEPLIDDDKPTVIHKENKIIYPKEVKDDENKKKKNYDPTLIQVQSSKKEEIKPEPKIEIKNDTKKENKNNFDLLKFEDNTKEEKIVVTNEIKREREKEKEKASDIIKNSLKENKIQDNKDDDGGLLIDDDEEDVNANAAAGAKTNTFIDKKKDINLGKVRIGKDGGNFLNNFTGKKNYEKGGIEKMENKIREGQFRSVLENNNDEDEDYKNKLREVEKEKQEKLKEYREYLLKMKKEKRENKAKEVLSPEELAKLESKKKLAEQLKAKRK